MNELQRERAEAEIAISMRPQADGISQAVGSPTYSSKHRFPDLRVMLSGHIDASSPGLSVSRFYFAAGVVVDVVPEARRIEREIAAKRRYCKEHGYRYILVADHFDEEGVRQQLAPVVQKRSTTKARPPVVQKRPRRATA